MTAPSSAPRILDRPQPVWAAGAQLGEGTLWSERQQALYWVDILAGRVMRYTPSSGQQESWDVPGETVSAVVETKDPQRLLLSLRHGLGTLDLASGRLNRLVDLEPERSANRFNDGACDAAGRFWAGSMDFDCQAHSGALYRYDASGRCQRVLDGLHISNGPTWSPDQRRMYFTETGHQRIDVLDFDPATGDVSNRREWLRFRDADGHPDGMTTDAQGRIWIAHFGAACVTCHAADGTELARIDLPTSQITNCAFGGPQLKTLYISSAREKLSADQLREQPLAGALFAVDVDATGLPAHRYAG